MTLKAIINLILCLPDLIKLLNRLEQKNTELGIQTKVKEDIKAINEAFDQNDPEKLRRVFNS